MKSLYRWMLLRPADKALPALSKTGPLSGPGLRVAMLLALIALLNGVDLACTLFANQIGWLNEMNPVVASVIAHGHEPILIGYKLLLVGGASIVLWRLRKSAWAAPACWILVIAYSALTVVWYLWSLAVSQGLEAQIVRF